MIGKHCEMLLTVPEMELQGVNSVEVTMEQFSKLHQLARQIEDRQIDQVQFVEACKRVVPDLKEFHENKLIIVGGLKEN